jgi:hypothetical protein
MKRTVLFLSFVLYLFFDAKAQNVPSIIPPSPNAAAFHVYGNTNLNYYTGSADISIPIFEIKEGDLTLPIYLKYTGGNGIKVEEIASWVGLGWTLNAGGAISRTIRGIADEDEIKVGFFKMTGIPIGVTSIQLIKNIGDGWADGEADKFMYNYPGGSGSFFYNYDKSIHLKPKKNIEVTHNIGIESESIYHMNCTTYGKVITNFTVIDEYGNSFLFKDKERSNTINLGVPYSDNRGFPTTWYLSKMENLNKTREISFDYDSYVYTLSRSNSIYSVNEAGEIDTYSETTYIGKRLSLITFSQGTVEFHESTSYRKDLGNNNYLDHILVKDKQGNILKTIKFNYQYMTPNGMESVTATTASDYDNRLILTSVEECDASDNCKSSTIFTYETSQCLPSRLSKAQDHWGYYNGATTNTKLEPEHFITYYDPTSQNWETILRGSADRNPNLTYSKAGVLKEIQYPTGGKTVFDYESHTAVNNDISGVLTPQNINLMWEDVVASFTVQLSSDANALTKFKVSGFYSDPVTECAPEIHIKNLTTNEIHLLSLPNGIYPDEVFLESGSYQAWFELESIITNTCTQDDPAGIFLKWDNEDSSPTKIVGGLRIKSISSYTDDNTLATKRNFSYIGDDTNSSGRIVNAPKYWGLVWDYILEVPAGYHRYVQTAIPLATTQGSDVGYGKVTFSYEDDVNGKTENYYSTATNFPDNCHRVNPIDGSEYSNIYQGVYYESYPIPTTDSRDLFRGRLDKQISYKKSNSIYTKVAEKLFTYEMLGSYHHPSALLPAESRAVRGIKVKNHEGGSFVTYYDIFTGYNLPSQTITKQYNDVGILTETTTQKYDVNINGYAEYYTSTSTETIGSDGITLKQNTEYVFNKASANKTTAEIDLTTKNALYLPLKTETYKDATKLTSTYTVYDNENTNWTGLNLPKSIQSATGTNSLEDRVIYHSYDDKGNIEVVSKKDGTSIVYIWGYQKSLPIAKIENATYSELVFALSQAPYSTTVESMQNYSDWDINEISEGALRDKLELIRQALSKAMVTTYTYDPLIGVTSITNPRGETLYYEYDDFNRLEYVKDSSGNVLSKNEYHFKNQ